MRKCSNKSIKNKTNKTWKFDWQLCVIVQLYKNNKGLLLIMIICKTTFRQSYTTARSPCNISTNEKGIGPLENALQGVTRIDKNVALPLYHWWQKFHSVCKRILSFRFIIFWSHLIYRYVLKMCSMYVWVIISLFFPRSKFISVCLDVQSSRYKSSQM